MLSRQSIVWAIAVWAGVWLAMRWGASAPPVAAVSPGYEVRTALSSWLWSGRYLLAVIVALALHPQVIARPFMLARSSFLPYQRSSRVEKLAFLYYIVLVIGGSLLFLWARASLQWDPLSADRTLATLAGLSPRQQWAVLVGLLAVSAVNARFCWQLGPSFQRKDLETWTAFTALASLQVALLAWIDLTWLREQVPQLQWRAPRLLEALMRDRLGALPWPELDWTALPDMSWLPQWTFPSWLATIWWPGLALLLVGLPTTSWALAWLSSETATPKRWVAIVTFLVSIVLSVLALSPYAASRLPWIAISVTAILIALTLLIGALSSYRRGFLTHLYQRYCLRWQRLNSQELVKALDSQAPLIRAVSPVLRVGIQVAVLVGNMLLQVTVLVSNVALFGLLWLVELLVRVPEMVGASIARVGRAVIFYVQYLVLPIFVFGGVGVAISSFVMTLANYQAAPAVSSGGSIILSVVVAIVGVCVGLASLFELPPERVMALYLKWGQVEIGKTPIGYLVYLLLSLWLLQSLGLLLGKLAWPELYFVLQPGMFYILESLLISIGLGALVVQLLRRR